MGALPENVVRELDRLATQRKPGNSTKRSHAPSCRPNITATRLRPDRSGDEQVKPIAPGPLLARALLMCGLNQILRGWGHQIADDRRFEADL
jgi:hypothetical protein